MIVELVAVGWRSGPLEVASGFGRRWRGLRPRCRGTGLLLGGGAVHGRGMAEPLMVVGFDADGRVVGVRRLDPGRFLRLPGAVMVAELATWRPPPPRGTTVGVLRVRT